MVLVFTLGGCTWGIKPPAAPAAPAVSTTLLKQLEVGGAVVAVEIADTPALRERGLSGRAGLPEGTGMLFVFDTPGIYEFWMQGMQFPLDFVWLSQGVVTQVNADVPAPSPVRPEPARLTPQVPVDRVLEVPAGWAAEHHVTVGGKVKGL